MIDWTRVNCLRDEVGADCFCEIVDLFLEEVDEGIDRLRNGVAPNALGPELHFLKGCALNLGFSEFSQLCQTGEVRCKAGEQDKVDMTGLFQCYDASRASFLSSVQGRPA
ncbi:Hpt domain-containing protein [Lutimaribacter sp. EGI FJ00015]|uniref:Hpt domain-containing protein n=1 Tax=Lutimaribacter degradans TaxID=2945989 RepID=A0ACC5ZUH2_9RHOB|nr:Hpt domain-containing protein [Lutimaribacter sp. EGI FJ00013]MCM2561956.1 Hpt domain-containing protein [Lutimaribacter sp. EGI FJ00013]MCO0613012.1 Hpt domain-containing protein [Lutimaribacter sp. EGI FJ00015]MCO0635788.1 Hpt domain-containing protein [Lutimaribacter sp. EGI FJ00014]